MLLYSFALGAPAHYNIRVCSLGELAGWGHGCCQGHGKPSVSLEPTHDTLHMHLSMDVSRLMLAFCMGAGKQWQIEAANADTA